MLERLGQGLQGEKRVISDEEYPWNYILDDPGVKSYTGKRVSAEGAISGVVAVYACVSFRAESISSLPCQLYKRVSEREREEVPETPGRYPGSLARTLHQSPNPEMSAAEFWELCETHLSLWGNFYAEIERSGDGRPVNLWPLRPDMMSVGMRSNGRQFQRRYVYKLPSGEDLNLARRSVFHVRGFGHDPLVGIPPIGVARQAVGIAVAAEEYAGKFFGNSAIPGGILSAERELKPEAVKALKQQWQDSFGGASKAQRLAVLHGGLKWDQLGIPPKDAQFVETRRWQLGDAARVWRIPPHLIGDTERSTSWGTGIEQQTIGYVVYTITPICTRIEAAINRDLRNPEAGLTLSDEDLFAKFTVAGLLRGDMAARGEFYTKGINAGWLMRQEPRVLEDLPLIDGLDEPLIPANMVVQGEEPPPPPEPDELPNPPNGPLTPSRAYLKHLSQLTDKGKSE